MLLLQLVEMDAGPGVSHGNAVRFSSPLRQENTPSFDVFPAHGRFYDYGTGASGDVFQYVMLKHGMTYAEAVQYVNSR